LEAVILNDLNRVLKLAKTDEKKFAEKLRSASQKENERGVQKAKTELKKSNTRIDALDRIISKIYEDNVEGKISDERFATMLSGYETEQTDLKSRTAELQAIVNEATEQTENLEAFLRLVRSYKEVKELTAEIIHEFIDKVIVSEAQYTPPRFSHWARGKTQEVRIVYNYFGDISEIIKDE
jgi:chromosome segregation ATPase